MNVKSVAFGSDHRGYPLKVKLIESLKQKGYQIKDFGTSSEQSCDYSDFGLAAAQAVGSGAYERGIVICHTGIGMSIAANKVKGVRAALCHSIEAAELTRLHNDSNVLAMGAGFIDEKTAEAVCLKWLTTEFEGGRHANRIQKISDFERKQSC